MKKRIAAFIIACAFFFLCVAHPVSAQESEASSAVTEQSEDDLSETMIENSQPKLPSDPPEKEENTENHFKEPKETPSDAESSDTEEVPEPNDTATSLGKSGEENSVPTIIYAILPLDICLDTYLEKNGDITKLAVDKVAYAQYGRFNFVECSIDWLYENFDSSAVGKQMLVGEVLLPDGYVFESYPLTVGVEITVYDPNSPATEIIISGSVWNAYSHAALPLGISSEDLQGHFMAHLDSDMFFVTESGEFLLADYTYDLSLIDTQTVGTYFPFDIDMPPFAGFSENAQWLPAVHIIDPKEVDLRNAFYTPSDGIIRCTWFVEITAPEVWVSVDEGEWVLSDRAYFAYISTVRGVCGLSINLHSLPIGHLYDFEVRYEDDGYSVNALTIDVTNGTPRLLKPRDGDRHNFDRKPEVGYTPDPEDGNNGNGTPPEDENDENNSDGGSTPTLLDSSGTPTPLNPDDSAPTPLSDSDNSVLMLPDSGTSSDTNDTDCSSYTESDTKSVTALTVPVTQNKQTELPAVPLVTTVSASDFPVLSAEVLSPQLNAITPADLSEAIPIVTAPLVNTAPEYLPADGTPTVVHIPRPNASPLPTTLPITLCWASALSGGGLWFLHKRRVIK